MTDLRKSYNSTATNDNRGALEHERFAAEMQVGFQKLVSHRMNLVGAVVVEEDRRPSWPGSKPAHELFVTHCLKCHAINGVGATFGPELDSPCSVTGLEPTPN